MAHPTQPKSVANQLFLTDEQLRKGTEAMFFAYRGFTADPDVLEAMMDEEMRRHYDALKDKAE